MGKDRRWGVRLGRMLDDVPHRRWSSPPLLLGPARGTVAGTPRSWTGAARCLQLALKQNKKLGFHASRAE